MSAELATVYNQNYGETITRNFKELLDTDLYVDLIFICRNNVKVGAHQAVMSIMSRFFYDMFIENNKITHEKVIHVFVPDIRPKIMKQILEFVYCGKARLHTKTELSEFNEDLKLLGMPMDGFSSSSGVNVVGGDPANTAKSVVNPPSVPQPTTTMINPLNKKTTDANTNSVTTTPLPQSVTTSDNSNVPPESLPSHQSESTVSCMSIHGVTYTSTSESDSSASPTVTSASIISNNLATPDLPVIVNAHSRSMSCTSIAKSPISAEKDPKADVTGILGNNVRGQNKTPLDDTEPLRKRRKPSENQASDLICLDSDDEKDDDVITLS